MVKKRLNKFKQEFGKTLKTAIAAALGLIMALAWRDVLQGYIEKLLTVSPLKGQLIGAIIITIISVIIILIISKINPEK